MAPATRFAFASVSFSTLPAPSMTAPLQDDLGRALQERAGPASGVRGRDDDTHRLLHGVERLHLELLRASVLESTELLHLQAELKDSRLGGRAHDGGLAVLVPDDLGSRAMEDAL
jgi:hypothetical protein